MFKRLADFANYIIGDTYSEANEGLKGRAGGRHRRRAGHRRPFATLIDIVVADELRTVLWPIPPDGDDASWELRRRDVGRRPGDARRLRRRRPPRPHVRRPVPHPLPRRHPARPQARPAGAGRPADDRGARPAVRAARPGRAGRGRPRRRLRRSTPRPSAPSTPRWSTTCPATRPASPPAPIGVTRVLRQRHRGRRGRPGHRRPRRHRPAQRPRHRHRRHQLTRALLATLVHP